MLALRTQLHVERYNAEISLRTGMCAASITLAGGVGILRTVPPPNHGSVASLRRAAAALGIDWPHGAHPGDVLDSVDRGNPGHVAFVEDAVALLRGTGYTPYDGRAPEQPLHSGLGAAYYTRHCTSAPGVAEHCCSVLSPAVDLQEMLARSRSVGVEAVSSYLPAVSPASSAPARLANAPSPNAAAAAMTTPVP